MRGTPGEKGHRGEERKRDSRERWRGKRGVFGVSCYGVGKGRRRGGGFDG